ncbi:MAG TPA: hypothetical protein VK743_09805 [Steroidobacteraceae bacterium]|jgi:hypothetical protein|nr:hypothetical protein [Steroidobacteraceae bacterium]
MFKNKAASRLVALVGACVFGLAAAGCHHNNLDSGFGVAWTTLSTTDDAAQFSSYIITVDSVVLVGKAVGEVSGIAVPETIDFTKLTNLSELWATASLPTDTYTQAIITLDYTTAQISVMVNGVPTIATIVDPSGAPLTAVTLTVNLDPNNLLTLQPTFATSNALRLAFDFDLSASNSINFATSPPTVTAKPYISVSTTEPDSKLIRVRGALINSSVATGTYTVVVRPFFDEVNSLGIDTIFNDANTVYTFGGNTYVGPSGLTPLSQTSAGSTVVAAFTTFEPTTTPAPGVNAGIFHSKYVVAGGTLEDFFTYGVEGDVTARNGNTLTLHGATLFANAAQLVQFEALDATVLLGPATQVTADGVSTLGPLNYNSIAVGQHITARGLFSQAASGAITLDSTGASATDTGSVRLQSTEIFGSVLSTAAGSLDLNLQGIMGWPISVYNFAGNGVSAGQDPTAGNFLVNTGSLTLPAFAAGDTAWIDGYVSPFGSAPPDFLAQSVSAEASVPATLVVSWTGTGTTAPFVPLSATGLTIDLTNAAFGSGQLRVGAQVIDITTLPASPNIVPAVAANDPTSGLPLFSPVFSVGPGAITESVISPIQSFNGFGAFVTQLNTTFATPTPATRFVARGLYDRAANTFTASIIDVVL